ncbi:hypothetical protein Tco_0702287 [Tanacetum coccineum]|uniref:Uncharacterized protein n=1 Tax=Tanacetum coccineum TaxID=301880 RepID=A0ABQ4XW63_9ASTR
MSPETMVHQLVIIHKQDLKNKGVIDSGFSRHITGNRSYLTDYEEIDEGFVAFRGNSKGGKITGKDFKSTDENHVVKREFRRERVGRGDDKKYGLKEKKKRGRKRGGRKKKRERERKKKEEEEGVKEDERKEEGKEEKRKSEEKEGGNKKGEEEKRGGEGGRGGKRREVERREGEKEKGERGKLERVRSKGRERERRGSEKRRRERRRRKRNKGGVEGESKESRGREVDLIGFFDIDALTNSMNYKPVVAGNQSNGNADPPFSSSLKDSLDVGFKPLGEEEKKDVEDPRKDSEISSTEEPRINQKKDASVNSTNNINTISPTINAASIEDNSVDENIVYGCADDPNIPELEDIVYSDDDEDIGAEADMKNLDAFMHVSPYPTTQSQEHPSLNKFIRDKIHTSNKNNGHRI